MNQSTEALNIENIKEPDFSKIGNLFKEARENRNITIRQASQSLHIRQLYISCIESGDLDALPGHVYRIGFIKTYAHYLNLDAIQILKDLNLLEEITPDYSSFNYSIPVEHQKRPNLKLILGATTFLFVSGVTLYVTNNARLHEDPTPLSETVVEDFKTPVLPEIQTPSAESISPEENTTATISASPIPSAGSDQILEPSSSSIRIIATKDAWVQVTDDSGKAIYVRLMRAGESYTLPDNDKAYHLNTGNGGGIKLAIGNKTTLPVGEDGKVIRNIDLSKDSVEKLLTEDTQVG